jgi:nucleotide-binding universal stress UspA family protein
MTSRSILCTIDFSDASLQALVWAIGIAQELNVHLTILYTYRLIHTQNENVVQLKKKLEEEASLKFAQLEKDVLLGRVLSYDFKTEVGFMTDRIEDHTRQHTISFVVMDKNLGASNKEVLDDLLEHIRAPLVIVPPVTKPALR